ncbi:response regulator [Agromyces humatus]|uniref:response regulator n=1 Tax=Agromyces humatus TaxID=279573 RepID=UPI001E314287|nr:response regulator transcription factor [Agromyces humatus]
MIRVLIVDDHQAVRAGLGVLLDGIDDLAIVGEAGDGREALRLIGEMPVDVVLMDVQMPVLDGVEATRLLVGRPDGPRVLVLTTFGVDDIVTAALAAGAAGFMLKTASADALIDAIRRVAAGDAVLAPEVTRAVVDRLRALDARVVPESPYPAASGRLADLTDREREVLDSLGFGLSNAEIADHLVISEATAKTHVSRVLGKLGLASRVQGALLARHEAERA